MFKSLIYKIRVHQRLIDFSKDLLKIVRNTNITCLFKHLQMLYQGLHGRCKLLSCFCVRKKDGVGRVPWFQGFFGPSLVLGEVEIVLQMIVLSNLSLTC